MRKFARWYRVWADAWRGRSTDANPVTTGFDAATNTLNVYGSGNTTQPIDTFHLGGATAYRAAGLMVSGTAVVFTAHPGS